MVAQAGGLAASPCIGKCSTSVGDDYCRGCLRSLEQIAAWPAMSASERQQSNQHMWQSVVNGLQQLGLEVLDSQHLAERLTQHRLRYQSQAPVAVWLFQGLVNSRSQDAWFADLVNRPELLPLVRKQQAEHWL